MSKKYLLFDVGATQMRLASFTQGSKKFSEPVVLKTPKKFSEGVKLIRAQASRLCGKQIAGAAGGIAGVLDKSKGILRHRGNLKDWQNKPLVKNLKKIAKGPVTIENDTAVVGLGEATAGAGRGHGIVAYITVSTGVNGARIVDKKIDPSLFGFETGKQIIDERGHTLEWHIAGGFIKKRFGKTPHQIKDKKFWQQVVGHLAVGLNNTILHWSPEVVVLGGGVMNEMTLPPIVSELKKVLTVYPKLPLIKRSELGDFGGLHGAMALIRQQR
ncbi:MAG: ROK family protein [Candidatus Doudnabacteria bacterium]|nr:ROK family protein [Candidatus Doudnabacteria bacterium]